MFSHIFNCAVDHCGEGQTAVVSTVMNGMKENVSFSRLPCFVAVTNSTIRVQCY